MRPSLPQATPPESFPTPSWLLSRLTRADLRPSSRIVASRCLSPAASTDPPSLWTSAERAASGGYLSVPALTCQGLSAASAGGWAALGSGPAVWKCSSSSLVPSGQRCEEKMYPWLQRSIYISIDKKWNKNPRRHFELLIYGLFLFFIYSINSYERLYNNFT